MSEYQKLEVWHKAMQLVVDTYSIIKKLPSEEKFCLASQMRNSSVSIPSNIAEGQARKSSKEFIHHLSFAIGSVAELETQLLLCEMLGYVEHKDIESSIVDLHIIDTMINRLIDYLRNQTTLKPSNPKPLQP